MEDSVTREMVAALQERGIDSVEKLRQMLDVGMYAVIPMDVLERNDLPPNSKLLYAEITALARRSGECFASNNYMADRIGVDKSSMPKILAHLKKLGLIDVVITRKPSGTYRTIYVTWKPQHSSVIVNKKRKKTYISSRRVTENETELTNRGDGSSTPPHGSSTRTKEIYIRDIEYTPDVSPNLLKNQGGFAKEQPPQDNEHSVPVVQGTPGDSSSPPNLRKKYIEMVEWAEKRRGGKFLKQSLTKQFKAFKIAKDNEISPQDLKGRWVDFERDSFWGKKGFDWMDVVLSFNRKR